MAYGQPFNPNAPMPGQSAMLGGGYSPWQAPLAALFSGISAAGQPGGWANFGGGVQQGANNFQQGQVQNQMMQLRQQQIQQAEEEMRIANQTREEEKQRRERISAILAGGPTGPNNGRPGGMAPQAPPLMEGATPQQAALFSLYGEIDPEAALSFATERAFAEPEQVKGVEIGGMLVNPVTGEPIADFSQEEMALRQAGGTRIVNNIGGDNPADAKLREKLSEEEGKRWSELQGAGLVSSGLGQDFQALDQLLTVAPQGPIQGNLATAFPGFSSAGDAFTSVVTRVAPSLRTPGSGATSDIEYEGMLKSLPRLGNTPEGNKAIAEMMKAKALLNIERASIVTAYQNEEISAADARRALKEINNRSILTPGLDAALKGVGVGGITNSPDADGWQEIDGVRIRVKP